MPTKQKEETIAAFTETLKGATAIYVSKNDGLSVVEVTELRNKLRAIGATHKVVKNTLAIRAAKAAGFADLSSFLTGPTVITISKGDVVGAAKVLTDYSKTHEKIQVVGGVIEGKAVSPAEVQVFASLPSKEELIGMLLRTINGPASGLARVINAIVEKKTAAAGPSAEPAA